MDKVPLAELCETITSGGTPSRKELNYWIGGTIPWIKTGELSDWKVNKIGERITPLGLEKSSAKIFDPGTILMAMYGDGRTITTLGIVDEPSATNQACCAFVPDPLKCVGRYLFYALKFHRHELLKLVVAGAQRNLSTGIIRRFPINVRPLSEQQRIAAILSAYDDLIENNRRRIALLEEAARQLYKEWFVRFRFPGHEHVKIIDGVPEGWSNARVADLGLVVTGKTPSKRVEENFGSDIPFIKTPDMHGQTLIVSSEEWLSERGANSQLNKTLPTGSVLVSCIGTIGVVAMTTTPAQTNQQINAVIPRHARWQFFAYFILEAIRPQLEAMGGGVTMANVNKSKFEGVPIIIASNDLITGFDDRVRPMFDLIETLSRQNMCLAKARDLLLPKLMSGAITV